MLIANHMKKVLLSISKDGVDDQRVFNDLRDISDGKIDLDVNTCQLHEFKEAPVATTSKKSKKKKSYQPLKMEIVLTISRPQSCKLHTKSITFFCLKRKKERKKKKNGKKNF